VRAALLFAMLVAVADLRADGGIEGTWLSADGDGWIEIRVTSDGPVGRIAGSPNDTDADAPRRDDQNPDPALRGRPLLGLTVLHGFRPDGPGKWKDGTVYDPNSGNTYGCKLRLLDPNTLEVRGYVGVPWLGRSEKWTRKANSKLD